ncbi:MAG: hypothetical protein HKP27_06280 [Myxococcales bacterium]|nr:hypothetical protein [Myxococcales bacterium]
MIDAVESVYESGQQLLLKRLDLLVAELRVLTESTVVGLVALLVALVGLFWLSYAAVELLSGHLPRAGAAALVGGVDAALGLGIAAYAKHKASRVERSAR